MYLRDPMLMNDFLPVIACPCALVIFMPVTVVTGMAAAAKRGMLLKGGIHLENARKTRAMPWTNWLPH